MMKATIRAEAMKTLLGALAPLVDEVRLDVTKTGVSCRAVDPAHVALVEYTLEADAFTSYEAEDMQLGLDLEKLKDILKLAANNDEIGLEYDESKHRLVFRIGHLTRHMALLDTTNMGEVNVPNPDLPAELSLMATELQTAMKASEMVTDHVEVRVTKETFEIHGNGDTDTVSLVLRDELIKKADFEGDHHRSLFSLDYLHQMAKVPRGDDAITLRIGTDYPLVLAFTVTDGKGSVRYMLAPRIESD